MGDGEQNEGQVWEAALFAAKYKLNNLCAIIDVNKIQIDGKTSEIMNTEPLQKNTNPSTGELKESTDILIIQFILLLNVLLLTKEINRQ